MTALKGKVSRNLPCACSCKYKGTPGVYMPDYTTARLPRKSALSKSACKSAKSVKSTLIIFIETYPPYHNLFCTSYNFFARVTDF